MSTNSLLTTGEWLAQSVKQLTQAGIGTARLDCLVLLEDTTGYDRTWLLAHPEHAITTQHTRRLRRQIAERTQHIPLAYIRGKSEFYGRNFSVNHRVLEPRPESETMIDLLKRVYAPGSTIVDVGTGSGALAITAKLELPDATVSATDIDPECLKVAQKNATRLQASVQWFRGNLLEPLPALPLSIFLLCNLPYVPDGFHINPAALQEPRIAIFGGSDGLNVYRQLFSQLSLRHDRQTLVFTESMPTQHEGLADIALKAGFALETRDDFIQVFRKA